MCLPWEVNGHFCIVLHRKVPSGESLISCCRRLICTTLQQATFSKTRSLESQQHAAYAVLNAHWQQNTWNAHWTDQSAVVLNDNKHMQHIGELSCSAVGSFACPNSLGCRGSSAAVAGRRHASSQSRRGDHRRLSSTAGCNGWSAWTVR